MVNRRKGSSGSSKKVFSISTIALGGLAAFALLVVIGLNSIGSAKAQSNVNTHEFINGLADNWQSTAPEARVADNHQINASDRWDMLNIDSLQDLAEKPERNLWMGSTPPVYAAMITVTGNYQSLGFDCGGKPAIVYGNDNTLVLSGECSSLTIRGNSNHITLSAQTMIKDYGNENVIVLGGQTLTKTPDQSVTPEETSTPYPTISPVDSDQITITNNDKVLTINCEGAAVIVNGNGNTLTLTGSCSSLTVYGNDNWISAPFALTISDFGNGNMINK